MAGKKKQAQLTPEEKLQQALVPIAEQPYKIPANWCWTKLMFIAKGFQYGYTEKATLEKIGPKYIRISDINNGNIDLSDAPYCKITDEYFLNYELKKGDILIARMGSVGVNAMFSDNERAVFASYLIRIIPIINNKFLSNFFKTDFYWHQIGDSAKGTTRLNVNANILKKMFVPLPPLAEQQRIVERIESLFAKLDEAKENLQNVLEGFETRKAAILHKAFTGELTAKWRKQHGVSMESWESVKVSNLCENIVCGKTPTSYIDNNGDIPYLKVYNIVNNKIDFDSKPQYIPKKIHESKLKSSILKPKDVIMNIVGPPLRKIAIIPDTYPEWNMNQAIVRFRTKEKLYYKYLYYYLIYPKTLDDIICETKGVVGQANISITQSRNLNINLPTFFEQTEIVRIIDDLLAKEQQAKELAENALSKVDLIKKTILSRAFRGELGTNNPADEPAIELLKKVL